MLSSKIRLTLDSGVFGLQRYGGISNYWNRLIEHIRAHGDFETSLLLPKRIINQEYNSVASAKMHRKHELLPHVFTRYFNGSAGPDCDIFHTSYYRPPYAKGNCKFIVTAYDFIYERYASGVKKSVHSAQKQRAMRLADAVICISSSTRQDTLRYCPSLDPSKVHIIPLGVDHTKFYHGSNPVDNELNDVVLFVGQRGVHKRFDLAVKAVKDCAGVRLGIIGPQLDEREVDSLDALLKGRWKFFGPVSSARLREIYSSAFCCIYPSDYEGFGLPILEALACGCPVVAANNSSLPEVGGAAALYANEQRPDCYAELINTIKPRRDQLVLRGIAHAQKFTWESTFNQTTEIYKNVLN